MPLKLELGYDIIRNYKRLAYKPWFALGEFVDNSTQSYYNNRTELDRVFETEKEKLTVRIIYDRDAGIIRISDNAMGMSYHELQQALIIGRPPANTDGRSQYGLGLKTAASWFGNVWKITTKKLGETEEFEVSIDVERIADGDTELDERPPIAKARELHYTIIEISNLNTKLHGRTIGNIKKYLKSMYRVDLREGVLDLFWEDAPLEWKDDLNFMRAADESEYRMEFEFDVGEKHVSGWLGILGAGSSGRPNAGFTRLRHGRVIMGWPEAWRPESIFGQLLGSNNLINQRIVGEIHLDEFDVSHTKDGILWMGDEQDVVEQKLAEVAVDYVSIAKIPRKGLTPEGPSDAEVQVAIDELRSELESKEFVDLIEIEAVPDSDVIDASGRPMVDAAKSSEPQFMVSVGDVVTCKLFLAQEASPMDLYFSSDITHNDPDEPVLSVVVNVSHPHWSQLADSESVLEYLRQCVYDAIAEWQCRRKTGDLQPGTIKGLKDGLLRLPSRIEAAAS